MKLKNDSRDSHVETCNTKKVLITNVTEKNRIFEIARKCFKDFIGNSIMIDGYQYYINFLAGIAIRFE